jgi:hypothetical protein
MCGCWVDLVVFVRTRLVLGTKEEVADFNVAGDWTLGM